MGMRKLKTLRGGNMTSSIFWRILKLYACRKIRGERQGTVLVSTIYPTTNRR
jgi:hypothetical protein